MFKKLPAGAINGIILMLYIAATGFLGFFHEFWRDELQSYLLVKGSDSIAALMANTRYEGHPSLWFFMLYGLKLIARGLLPMKILHLLISSVVAWLILQFSPFKTLQKILLLAGYFFFYEYAFLVRNYALGLLFIFAFCALFPRRSSPRYFMLMAVAVAGMMLSDFYSFFIGFAMALLLVTEHVLYPPGRDKMRKLVPGYLLMAAALILFFLDTVPPADYGYANTWNTAFGAESITDLFARVCHVFFPVPMPGVHFWNSVIYPNVRLQAFTGLAIIITMIFLFARKGLSRWFIIFNLLVLLGFSFFKFNGYLRHNGHLFIVFIAMLWLQRYLPGKPAGREKLQNVLLYLVLSVQVIATMIAVGCEVVYPFSQSKNAADYISKNFHGNLIVANEDAGTSPVCAFLGVPLFYPASNRFGTFIIWNAARLEPVITTACLVRKGDSLEKIYRRKAVYLANYPVDSAAKYGLLLQKSFTPSVELRESYWIYTRDSVQPDGSGAGPMNGTVK